MENKSQINLAKWLAGELTEAELSEFQKSSDYAVFEKIKNYSSELNVKTSLKDDQQILERILKTKKQNKVIALRQSLYKIAAVLIIAFSLYFLYYPNTINKETENAELLSFYLPDQSKVLLNAGSEVEYSEKNWDKNREIELNGEAYFEVEKGKKFTVLTATGAVTVLGTRFNVKVRNNRLDVTCYEGKVEVTSKGKKTILTKGKSVIVKDFNFIPTTTTENSPLWEHKILVFEKENLTNIVDELKRHYDIDIEISVETNKLFSGKIPADNISIALKTLSTTYQIKTIKKTENNYILTN